MRPHNQNMKRLLGIKDMLIVPPSVRCYVRPDKHGEKAWGAMRATRYAATCVTVGAITSVVCRLPLPLPLLVPTEPIRCGCTRKGTARSDEQSTAPPLPVDRRRTLHYARRLRVSQLADAVVRSRGRISLLRA